MSVTIILALSLFGLAVAFYYSRSVNRVAVDMGVEDADTRGKLRKIHSAIAEGAMAFLKEEYKFMTIFMVVFGIVIALLIDDHHTENVNEGIYTAVAFIFGAIISIASGYIGMKIATAATFARRSRPTSRSPARSISRCTLAPSWASRWSA
jgi:Na+/H+-translocating membrane pyrophosphatase